MSFVACRCGALHWGRYGAAGLLLTDLSIQWILLQLRAASVQHPHTWALLGGAIEAGETATEAALREAQEEAGVARSEIRALGITLIPQPDCEWSYTYVHAQADLLTPLSPSRETQALAWKRIDKVAELPNLHPALARDWSALFPSLEATR